MKKQNIHFTNEHGAFELEINERYDFDMLDESGNGDVFPVSNSKVLSATERIIKLEDYEGEIFHILKSFVVHETKKD